MDDAFVASLTTTDLVTVTADTPVEAAAHCLREGVGSLVVVDDRSRIEGILTSTDFVDVVAESHPKAETAVGRYTTEGVITVDPQDPIEIAADKTVTYNVHHLPVVDDDGVAVGMLSTTDIAACVSNTTTASTA